MASVSETLTPPLDRPKSGWFNKLIVLATVGLVVGPILLPALKRERAKWRLAAAMNEVEIGGDGSLADNLEKASAELGDLKEHHDFWVFLTKQALEEDFERVPEVIRDAKESGAAYGELANYAIGWLSVRDSYRTASTLVEIQELVLDKQLRANPIVRNDLAYRRALVADDLDLALTDINEAIEAYPNDASFRDTRAWVLYQMGRPIEALEDADHAVEKFEETLEEQEEFNASLLGQFASFLESFVGGPMSGSDTLTRSEAGEVLWTQGVLRYHRMRILESLGREEEAHADLDWLVQKRLPTNSKLH